MLRLDSKKYVRIRKGGVLGELKISKTNLFPADFIHVCHESDLELAKCITQSMHNLRPKVASGIPEMNVPSIEPLELGNLIVSQKTKSRSGLQITAKDIKAYNSSLYQVYNMKYEFVFFLLVFRNFKFNLKCLTGFLNMEKSTRLMYHLNPCTLREPTNWMDKFWCYQSQEMENFPLIFVRNYMDSICHLVNRNSL